MELKIETIYENVDDAWLEWYLQRLANEEVLPGSTAIVSELRMNNYAAFESKDPESDVIAKTSYWIINPDRETGGLE